MFKKNKEIFLNILDLDDTILYPSPYRLLSRITDNIDEQHKIAQTDEFRALLEFGNLAPWIQTKSGQELLKKAFNIIVTGRHTYNSESTVKFIARNGLRIDEIHYVPFESSETYISEKIRFIDDYIEKFVQQNNSKKIEIRVFDDNDKILLHFYQNRVKYDNCNIETILISDGELTIFPTLCYFAIDLF